MRFLVEATRDIVMNYGRPFNHKKGETEEMSADDVEIARSEGFDNAYKVVREIPETESEKARAKAIEQREQETAKLSGTPKEKLVKQAEKLKIEGAAGLNKTPLVERIVAAKLGETGATAPPEVPTNYQPVARDGYDFAADGGNVSTTGSQTPSFVQPPVHIAPTGTTQPTQAATTVTGTRTGTGTGIKGTGGVKK